MRLIRQHKILNEDFFDDFNSNDLNDDPVDDLIGDPDYTYHIHFIICMYPFIKDNDRNGECAYYFEDPKYKPIIESGFISMKKALDYILNASSIITDYSKPKFCSSSEKIINLFPFITNNQSNEFEINDNQFIILKTSIKLSRRKNEHNLLKMFHSFWRLQQIYDNLITKKMFDINIDVTPRINIGIYKENPYKKTVLYPLMQSNKELTSQGSELINLLNSKDETEQ